jgi:8-oxo-dGTP pyrophosphatase MutT (NUDIX family)
MTLIEQTPLTPWEDAEACSLQQACVVPYRQQADRLEVCLITSMRGRWIFPKGIIDPGETYRETALKEALEEAGLHGRLVGAPLGVYNVWKFGRNNTVIVLLMEVEQAETQWAESSVRQRRWASPTEARRLLSRQPLKEGLDTAVMRIRDAAGQTEGTEV